MAGVTHDDVERELSKLEKQVNNFRIIGAGAHGKFEMGFVLGKEDAGGGGAGGGGVGDVLGCTDPAASNYNPFATVDDGSCVYTLGACCDDNGNCFFISETDCADSGGTYQGDDVSCEPNQGPCRGACCESEGCTYRTEDVCVNELGGTYLGGYSTCDPDPCAAPTGACCFPDCSCEILNNTDCSNAGGNYQGYGTTCLDSCPNECPCYSEMVGSVTGTFSSGGDGITATLTLQPLESCSSGCGYSGSDELGNIIEISYQATTGHWSGSVSSPGVGVFWDGDGPSPCLSPYGSYGDGSLVIT